MAVLDHKFVIFVILVIFSIQVIHVSECHKTMSRNKRSRALGAADGERHLSPRVTMTFYRLGNQIRKDAGHGAV
jgi:hypothetical protein